MTIPNPIEQGNGVNMFVRLWRAFVLGSVCLVLLGIEMVLISLQTFPLLRMQGLRFGRVEIILFCTFVGNFAFIKVNSGNKFVKLTTTIVANWDHIYFLVIKRKEFYHICHSTLSVIKSDVCLSVHRCICVEKKNRLDTTECFIALIICSTCFGHFYAHHQELETICVLLPPMVSNALVTGGRRSGAGQQAMCPG